MSEKNHESTSAGGWMLRMLVIAAVIICALCCSHSYVYREMDLFQNAAGKAVKNLDRGYELLFEQELDLRQAEACDLETVSPGDLEAKVFPDSRLEKRRLLMRYFSEYPQLLRLLARDRSSRQINERIKSLYRSLRHIADTHHVLFSAMDLTFIGLAALPDALSAVKRRQCIIKLMKSQQEVINILKKSFARDFNAARKWAQRCMERRFRFEVARCWPDRPDRRIKYARLGSRIIQEKRVICALFRAAEEWISEFARVHSKIREHLCGGPAVIQGLADLGDLSSRMDYFSQYFQEH